MRVSACWAAFDGGVGYAGVIRSAPKHTLPRCGVTQNTIQKPYPTYVMPAKNPLKSPMFSVGRGDAATAARAGARVAAASGAGARAAAASGAVVAMAAGFEGGRRGKRHGRSHHGVRE